MINIIIYIYFYIEINIYNYIYHTYSYTRNILLLGIKYYICWYVRYTFDLIMLLVISKWHHEMKLK